MVNAENVRNASTVSAMAQEVPQDHARFHLFRYKHTYEGDYLESPGKKNFCIEWEKEGGESAFTFCHVIVPLSGPIGQHVRPFWASQVLLLLVFALWLLISEYTPQIGKSFSSGRYRFDILDSMSMPDNLCWEQVPKGFATHRSHLVPAYNWETRSFQPLSTAFTVYGNSSINQPIVCQQI